MLRLLETFSQQEVHAAVKDAIHLGALSFDAMKHLVLCRLEGRPPRLDWESVTTEMPRHAWLINCKQDRWSVPPGAQPIKRSGEHPPCHREAILGRRGSSDAATPGGCCCHAVI